ncbi:MAG: type II toxin-antitoxin system RelE/ParE family toxin [Clostridiales bacterium]|jgi:plasmid stabilization system protein ParE|nr:type II toxin-antitoxin system RelE/ParE family toxin [Clostridiales bacterium]
MAKLDINITARTDLANIKLYLRQCSEEELYPKFEERIIKSWQHLASFPQSGTKPRIKEFIQYRYIIKKPYYIFYTYQEQNDTVTIQRIVHTARNFKKLLEENL